MARFHVRYRETISSRTVFWIDATETNDRYEYTSSGTSPAFAEQCLKLKTKGGVMVEAESAEPDNSWKLEIVQRALATL